MQDLCRNFFDYNISINISVSLEILVNKKYAKSVNLGCPEESTKNKPVFKIKSF